jgi:hypothetical protein
LSDIPVRFRLRAVPKNLLGHLLLRLEKSVDLLLDRSSTDELVNENVALLPDAEGSIRRLVLDRRAPPAIEVNLVGPTEHGSEFLRRESRPEWISTATPLLRESPKRERQRECLLATIPTAGCVRSGVAADAFSRVPPVRRGGWLSPPRHSTRISHGAESRLRSGRLAADAAASTAPSRPGKG